MMNAGKDWWCYACDFKIFASKSRCGKCGAQRPGARAALLPQVTKPGDWPCAACQFPNFASRSTCLKCNHARPPAIAVPAPAVQAEVVPAPAAAAAPAVRECCICLVAESNVVFMPCKHMRCCSTCAGAVNECPLCRVAIVKRVQLFV